MTNLPEPPACTRCGIKEPITISVLHDPLCPNCLHLKNYNRREFRKAPAYGPVPASGWPNPLSLYTR